SGHPPISVEKRRDRNEFSMHIFITSRANASLSRICPLFATTVRQHFSPSLILLTASGIPHSSIIRSPFLLARYKKRLISSTAAPAVRTALVSTAFVFTLLLFAIFAPF